MTESKLMSVYVEPELHARVRVAAAILRVSIKELAEEALRERVERVEKRSGPEWSEIRSYLER